MSNEVDSIAAGWAVRVERGALTAQEKQALEAWLAQDRRHLGAYARARAVDAHFTRAKALGRTFDFRRFLVAKPFWSYRPWAAAIIAGSTVAVVVIALSLRGAPDLTTRRGEVRLIPLGDGSAVTLNTDTRLGVKYSSAERVVELEEGEALFDVAHDRARPFVVHAGSTSVRAIGTSFSVRRLDGGEVKVLVREGVVEVTQSTSDDRAPIRVSARSQAVLKPHARATIDAIQAPQVDRQLAWREGMISLDGRTLREAAKEFARYGGVRIRIDDPAIADRTVTGLFLANNPAGFARAVATSMNLQISERGDEVSLSRQ
jgi:transmembrane sensor